MFDQDRLIDLIFLDIKRGHGLAVSQNCNRIGDFHNFTQFVRDENAGHTLFFKTPNQSKEVVTISFIQCCSGFIQNEDLYLFFQSFSNFNKLLFTNPKVFNFCQRIYIQTDLFQNINSLGNRLV